jgi:hypothetical protein
MPPITINKWAPLKTSSVGSARQYKWVKRGTKQGVMYRPCGIVDILWQIDMRHATDEEKNKQNLVLYLHLVEKLMTSVQSISYYTVWQTDHDKPPSNTYPTKQDYKTFLYPIKKENRGGEKWIFETHSGWYEFYEWKYLMESGPMTAKPPPPELLMLSNALERLVARNNRLSSIRAEWDDKKRSLSAFTATRTPAIAIQR